ncbi:MAG: GNAT family N-acetyltransferase [Candidatus Omnitrophica bacterium]|nr:GNAT family N-acetyltransferase [Candidatus Omnitrophota bacterium]
MTDKDGVLVVNLRGKEKIEEAKARREAAKAGEAAGGAKAEKADHRPKTIDQRPSAVTNNENKSATEKIEPSPISLSQEATEALIRGAEAVVKEAHALQHDAIFISGNSGELTYIVFSEIWQKIYPSEKMPSIYMLNEKANKILYKEEAELLEFVYTSFQKEKAICEAIGDSNGDMLESLRHRKVLFLDDHTLSGRKYVLMKTALEQQIGFKDVRYAFFVGCSEASAGSRMLVGYVSPNAADEMQKFSTRMSSVSSLELRNIFTDIKIIRDLIRAHEFKMDDAPDTAQTVGAAEAQNGDNDSVSQGTISPEEAQRKVDANRREIERDIARGKGGYLSRDEDGAMERMRQEEEAKARREAEEKSMEDFLREIPALKARGDLERMATVGERVGVLLARKHLEAEPLNQDLARKEIEAIVYLNGVCIPEFAVAFLLAYIKNVDKKYPEATGHANMLYKLAEWARKQQDTAGVEKPKAHNILSIEERYLSDRMKSYAGLFGEYGLPQPEPPAFGFKAISGDSRHESAYDDDGRLTVVFDLAKIKNAEELRGLYWLAVSNWYFGQISGLYDASLINPWEAVEEVRAYLEFMNANYVDRCGIGKSDTILDIGTLTGRMALLAARRTDNTVYGIDISPLAVKIAREEAGRQNIKNVEFSVNNVLNIPFEKGSIDAAMANYTFTTIPAPLRLSALKEVHRVLKEGGNINLFEYPSPADGPNIEGNQWAWTEKEWEDNLKRAGFSNVTIGGVSFQGELYPEIGSAQQQGIIIIAYFITAEKKGAVMPGLPRSPGETDSPHAADSRRLFKKLSVVPGATLSGEQRAELNSLKRAFRDELHINGQQNLADYLVFLSFKERDFTVLLDGPKVAGFMVDNYGGAQKPLIYELHGIYLDKAHRGTGAVWALLDAVKERVESTEYKKMRYAVAREGRPFKETNSVPFENFINDLGIRVPHPMIASGQAAVGAEADKPWRSVFATGFFRGDREQRKRFNEFIDKLAEKTKRGESIRVLSAGCATGEEAYTIAMALLEKDAPMNKVRVVGVDYDIGCVRKARKGEYNESSVKDIPPDLIEKYLTKQESGDYVINQNIRNITQFNFVNLTNTNEMKELGEFDGIVYMNVDYLLSPEEKSKAYENLTAVLKHDGLLLRSNNLVPKEETRPRASGAVIRDAIPEDAEAISNLSADIWKDGYQIPVKEVLDSLNMIKTKGGYLLVSIIGNELAGFLYAEDKSWLSREKHVHVTCLATVKKWRDQGVAAKLFKEFFEKARIAGYVNFSIRTEHDAVIRIIRKYGFKGGDGYYELNLSWPGSNLGGPDSPEPEDIADQRPKTKDQRPSASGAIEIMRPILLPQDKPVVAVFDIHGTLLEPNWKGVYRNAYKTLTGEYPSDEWMNRHVINKNDEEIINVLCRISNRTAEEIKTIIANARKGVWEGRSPPAIPGALELVKALASRGVPVIMVSGAPKKYCLSQLKEAGFLEYIPEENIIGSYTDNRKDYDRVKVLDAIKRHYPSHSIAYFDDWTEAKGRSGEFAAWFGIPQGEGKEFEDNRQSLIDAGVNCIIREGYDWTTLDGILTVPPQVQAKDEKIPVAEGLAQEIVTVIPAPRHNTIGLHVDVSDDLKTITYSLAGEDRDNKVFKTDGAVDYSALKLTELVRVPSSYLITPQTYIENNLTPEIREKLLPLLAEKKRFTRYGGITTSWDIAVDKDVWTTNIDTVFLHKRMEELGTFNDNDMRSVIEIGVGGGHLSTAIAACLPNLKELSVTDISIYALQTAKRCIEPYLKVGTRVKYYLGKGIKTVEGGADLIIVNPPYIPTPPFIEDKKDPYRGTGLIREILDMGIGKLNRDNPNARILMNISSLAQKDFEVFCEEFKDRLDITKVGEPLKVPLKILGVIKEWRDWLVSEGGLEYRPDAKPGEEKHWHTLQIYSIRPKMPVKADEAAGGAEAEKADHRPKTIDQRPSSSGTVENKERQNESQRGRLVTKEEVAAAFDSINEVIKKEAPANSFNEEHRERITKGLSEVGLTKGKSILIVGPGQYDYLPVLLAKLGLEVHAIDISEKVIQEQRHLYSDFGLEEKIKTYTSYDDADLKDKKFDYIMALLVMNDAVHAINDDTRYAMQSLNYGLSEEETERIKTGLRAHMKDRLEMFIRPLLEHLNPNGGQIFISDIKSGDPVSSGRSPSSSAGGINWFVLQRLPTLRDELLFKLSKGSGVRYVLRPEVFGNFGMNPSWPNEIVTCLGWEAESMPSTIDFGRPDSPEEKDMEEAYIPKGDLRDRDYPAYAEKILRHFVSGLMEIEEKGKSLTETFAGNGANMQGILDRITSKFRDAVGSAAQEFWKRPYLLSDEKSAILLFKDGPNGLPYGSKHIGYRIDPTKPLEQQVDLADKTPHGILRVLHVPADVYEERFEKELRFYLAVRACARHGKGMDIGNLGQNIFATFSILSKRSPDPLVEKASEIFHQLGIDQFPYEKIVHRSREEKVMRRDEYEKWLKEMEVMAGKTKVAWHESSQYCQNMPRDIFDSLKFNSDLLSRILNSVRDFAHGIVPHHENDSSIRAMLLDTFFGIDLGSKIYKSEEFDSATDIDTFLKQLFKDTDWVNIRLPEDAAFLDTRLKGDWKWLAFSIENAINGAYRASKDVTDKVPEVTFKIEGNNLVVAISDNGIGIPKEDLIRVSDADFTTKRGETGQAVMHRTLRDHGGECVIDSLTEEETNALTDEEKEQRLLTDRRVKRGVTQTIKWPLVKEAIKSATPEPEDIADHRPKTIDQRPSSSGAEAEEAADHRPKTIDQRPSANRAGEGRDRIFKKSPFKVIAWPKEPKPAESDPAKDIENWIGYMKRLVAGVIYRMDSLKVFFKLDEEVDWDTFRGWLGHPFGDSLSLVEWDLHMMEKKGPSYSSMLKKYSRDLKREIEITTAYLDGLTQGKFEDDAKTIKYAGNEEDPVPYAKLPMFFAKRVYESNEREDIIKVLRGVSERMRKASQMIEQAVEDVLSIASSPPKGEAAGIAEAETERKRRTAKMIDELSIGPEDEVLQVGAGSSEWEAVYCASRGARVTICQPPFYGDQPVTRELEEKIAGYGELIQKRIDTALYRGLAEEVGLPKKHYSYVFLLNVLDPAEGYPEWKEDLIRSVLESCKDEAAILISSPGTVWIHEEMKAVKAIAEKFGYEADYGRSFKGEREVFELKVKRLAPSRPDSPEPDRRKTMYLNKERMDEAKRLEDEATAKEIAEEAIAKARREAAEVNIWNNFKWSDEPKGKNPDSLKNIKEYLYYLDKLLDLIASLHISKCYTRKGRKVEIDGFNGWLTHTVRNHIFDITWSEKPSSAKLQENFSNLQKGSELLLVYLKLLVERKFDDKEIEEVNYEGTKKDPVPYDLLRFYFAKQIYGREDSDRVINLFKEGIPRIESILRKTEKEVAKAVKNNRNGDDAGSPDEEDVKRGSGSGDRRTGEAAEADQRPSSSGAEKEKIEPSQRTTLDMNGTNIYKYLRSLWHKLGAVPIICAKTMSIVYSPGVARFAKLAAEEEKYFNEFVRIQNDSSRRLWIVSDGSAVLGLGNIGFRGAGPVMEGKQALLKWFGNVEANILLVDTREDWESGNLDAVREKIIKEVDGLKKKYGNIVIMLEDIASPVCFSVEKHLNEELKIPTMHDDQHGTAITVCAAAINALKISGRAFKEAKIVINGSGASAVATAHLLHKLGIEHIIVFDSKGAIHGKRKDLNDIKKSLLGYNLEGFSGDIKEALKNADGFIGLSKPGVFLGREMELLSGMRSDAFVFACSNPEPEFDIAEIARQKKEGGKFSSIAVTACGKFGIPGISTINNCYAFPGVFRALVDAIDEGLLTGSIDVKRVTARASYALASMVSDEQLKNGLVLPPVFNKAGYDTRITQVVAEAVFGILREGEIPSGSKYSALPTELAEMHRKTEESIDPFALALPGIDRAAGGAEAEEAADQRPNLGNEPGTPEEKDMKRGPGSGDPTSPFGLRRASRGTGEGVEAQLVSENIIYIDEKRNTKIIQVPLKSFENYEKDILKIARVMYDTGPVSGLKKYVKQNTKAIKAGLIKEGEEIAYVALVGKEVAGYIFGCPVRFGVFCPHSSEELVKLSELSQQEQHCYLWTIGIDHNVREKGLGAILLYFFAKKALKEEIPEINTLVDDNNKYSKLFLEKFGFKFLREHHIMDIPAVAKTQEVAEKTADYLKKRFPEKIDEWKTVSTIISRKATETDLDPISAAVTAPNAETTNNGFKTAYASLKNDVRKTYPVSITLPNAKGKALVVYAESMLKNCSVLDVEQTMATNALDNSTIFVYGHTDIATSTVADILRDAAKISNKKVDVKVLLPTDVDGNNTGESFDESVELENLMKHMRRREGINNGSLIGIIKGGLDNVEFEGKIKEKADQQGVPVVCFAPRPGIYLFSDALKGLFDMPAKGEWFRLLPPSTIHVIQELYNDYQRVVEELLSKA